MHFFPDADKSCKNPSRLWFATKLPVEIINEYPTLASAFGGVEMSYKMDEGMTAKDAKKNKKVAKWIQEDCADDDAYYVEENGTWEEQLKGVCPLWRKWCDGEYLNYDNRLMLWTNLKSLKYHTNRISIADTIWKYYNEETYKAVSYTHLTLPTILLV